MLSPEDITEKLGIHAGEGIDIVYIHKTASYTNYIGVVGNKVAYIQNGERKDIMTIPNPESVRKVVTLGNILGIITDDDVTWLLYKEGKYERYENDIPFPRFRFHDVEIDGDIKEEITDWDAIENPIRQLEVKWEGNDGALGFTDLETSYNGNKDVVDKQPAVEIKHSGSTIAAVRYKTRENLSHITDAITKVLGKNASLGYYDNQIMAVLAVRLFDDSRIMSVPVLISPGYEFPYKIDYELDSWFRHFETQAGTQGITQKAKIYLRSLYRLGLKIDEGADFFANYKDIVRSIEVYVSKRAVYDHYQKLRGRALDQVIDGPTTTKDDAPEGPYLTTYNEKATIEFGSKAFSYEDEYNTMSVFYKIKEYDVSETSMADLCRGIVIDNTDLMNEELLINADRLDPLSDMSHYSVTYSGASQYNNRILASGVSQYVRFQLSGLNAVKSDRLLGSRCRLTFHLKDNNGKESSIYASFGSGDVMDYESDNLFTDKLYKGIVYSYIICPDPRAFKVDIEMEAYGRTYYGSLPMVKHPYLQCSYYYGGMDKMLIENLSEEGSYERGVESVVDELPNKLYVSAMDNPFVFPINSRFTFSDKVIGVAIATAALSPGQFGQFPVYVFTEGGVWTMETNSSGDFVTSKPVNRHVAISPRLITSLDNSVLFLTREGVYMMSGSEAVNISANMVGMQWTLKECNGLDLILRTIWGKFKSLLIDKTPFMTFMKNAEAAYDYIGKRIIFFRYDIDCKFAYVYKMDTQTWHKISLPDDMMYSHVLNSYPDAFVSFRRDETLEHPRRRLMHGDKMAVFDDVAIGEHVYDNYTGPMGLTRQQTREFLKNQFGILETPENEILLASLFGYLRGMGRNVYFDVENVIHHAGIYDFSTSLELDDDYTDDEELESVIITRAFDLDEPDVLKTINHLHIRGHYEKFDTDSQPKVQYILLGSNDGFNYYRLKSLRGKSFKMFRMVILSKLRPTERLSWIDIDYETRFTNKLR